MADQFIIAVGASCRSTEWHNTAISWDELKGRLRHTRTACTLAQYEAMSREERGRIKDVGGFVGGELITDGGHRTNDNLKCRTLLTLDVDHAKELPSHFSSHFAMIVYSTHSHTPEAPRYRIVAPLSRPCDAVEYQAVAHAVAQGVGIEAMDMTSCEPARLMYWAAAPQDAEVFYHAQDGAPLDVDEILKCYKDYRNPSEWAGGKPVDDYKRITRGTEKLGDPARKENIVGAWCRTYDCYDVLDNMIPGVYAPATPTRYTYAGAKGWGGMVIYDDGAYCYSFHQTDPLGGRLMNSWDLLRLVKYGDLDKGAAPTTRTDRLPSSKAMAEEAMQDDRVRSALLAINASKNGAGDPASEEATNDTPEEIPDWYASMGVTASGTFANTLNNFATILRNDEDAILGQVVYDEFRGEKIIQRPLPWEREEMEVWTDADMAQLALYIEEKYNIRSMGNLQTAFEAVIREDAFRVNSVKNFIESAEWDGTPRIDDLFIKYLGVPDKPLFRTITRRCLVACVARAYRPGIKYDQITVLVGAQGIGKSSILRRLAGGDALFCDSFTLDEKSNKMQESVRGSWIIEIPELEGFYKGDMNTIKSFVSKQWDTFRPAYAREKVRVPRTCVFFATTNDEEFLRDSSGNRRFWILPCGEPTADLSDLTPEEVQQVWAEAKVLWDLGKIPLYLSREEGDQLAQMQKSFDVDNDLVGKLEAFLDVLLPYDWSTYQMDERREYFKCQRSGRQYVRIDANGTGNAAVGLEKRMEVSAVEVLNEFLMNDSQNRNLASRHANTLLRKLDGWYPTDERRILGGGYGRQKVYKRR